MTLPKLPVALLRNALLTIVVLTLLPFALQAQNATGSLLGEVQDATGARINSATVVATDSGSGVAHQATTDNRGQFRFPELLPGT
jgi:Carboxypeptidase regulatory-like domain